MVRKGLVDSLRNPSSMAAFYDDFEHELDSELWEGLLGADNSIANGVVAPVFVGRVVVRNLNCVDGIIRVRIIFGAPWLDDGVCFHVVDGNNLYLFTGLNGGSFYRRVGGVFTQISPNGPGGFAAGVWYNLEIRITGFTFDAYLDSVYLNTGVDPLSLFPSGRVGTHFWTPGSYIDDFTLIKT